MAVTYGTPRCRPSAGQRVVPGRVSRFPSSRRGSIPLTCSIEGPGQRVPFVLRLAAEIATDVHPDQPHRAQLADTMSDETLTQEDPAGHPQGPRPVARGQRSCG
jgi:hypothetical protein